MTLQCKALLGSAAGAAMTILAMILPTVIAEPRQSWANVQYAWQHAGWHRNPAADDVLLAEAGP